MMTMPSLSVAPFFAAFTHQCGDKHSKQSLLAYAENRIGPRVPECDVAALALDGLRAAFESGASVDETFVAIANANRKVVDLSGSGETNQVSMFGGEVWALPIDAAFFASGLRSPRARGRRFKFFDSDTDRSKR